MLLDRAVEVGDAYLPGYTHLQRAQPVLLAHHLLAHGWALARDVDRLLGDRSRGSTCRRSARARWPARRCRSIPDGTAADLGFAAAFENSLDAVSDRDFVAEALFDLVAARRAPLAHRRGDRAVVDRAEFGFRGARRRLRHRQLDDARRRRTPTSPSWHGGRPAG